MRLKYFLILISISALLYSCNNDIYNQEVKIPENVWDMNNILKYDVEIPSDSTSYDVCVNVRHSQFYPSSNLWLFINVTTPNGAVQRDTLECVLAEETGKWLGSGMGDIYDIEIPYKKDVWFTSKGKFTFEIQHGMRLEKLPLIMSVGLVVKKSEVGK